MSYYSLHLKGQEDNETDKFFSQFMNSEYQDDISDIVYWLAEIGNNRGAEPRYFRFEKAAEALPPKFADFSKLRLFCLRCTKDVVILGNGGRKTSQRVQDSKELYPIFQFMNKVNQAFTEKIQVGEITYGSQCLLGDLNLTIVS